MRTFLFILLIGILLNDTAFTGAAEQPVFRIGGLELSPYSYGYMETQPHHPIDKSNTGFANYYAKISLWLGGITAEGDTIVCGPEIGERSAAADFSTAKLFRDTVNVLQLADVKFSMVSGYRDAAKNWQVNQYNVATLDYNYGALLYEIRYEGKSKLIKVFAGVHFDFDAPDKENTATSDDDRLLFVPNGFIIEDFSGSGGIKVHLLENTKNLNYWTREKSPQTVKQLYDCISANVSVTPKDTADYHFYIGSGPFKVKTGDRIILGYLLAPYQSGFNKSSQNNAAAEDGFRQFLKGKSLAITDNDLKQSLQNVGIMPQNYSLRQNYPNPFNPVTEIQFTLPEEAPVKLEIFNSIGQSVKVLANDNFGAGVYSFRWKGEDESGNPLSSGIYLYRLTAGNFHAQKKMLLIR